MKYIKCIECIKSIKCIKCIKYFVKYILQLILSPNVAKFSFSYFLICISFLQK